MNIRKRLAVTTNQTILIVVLIVVVAGGGYWWYSSSLQQEPTYSRFGFSFDYPEGMTFTSGALLGGFDHARPVYGDIQGIWEEVPETMGVIWIPEDWGFNLTTALDGALEGAEEVGIVVVSRGEMETGEKDGQELLYQSFELSDAGVSQKGMIGAWNSEEDGRIYLLFLITLPEVGTPEELHSRWRGYVDSFACADLPPPTTEIEAYWPTDGWRTATPEAVGMDPELLDGMIEHVTGNGIGADSILVIRHGYIVSDAYFPPFDEGEIHEVYSCTKSVVSTLMGIALEEGYLESLNQRVLEFFPNRTAQNSGSWKEEMTLRDFLTMTAGFDAKDSYLYNWEGLERMHNSSDWVQYVLDLPMAEKPGSRFEYTNGVSHLLSCIITETTGMSALDFAKERLFGPLNISDFEWRVDPTGNNWGYSGLYLTPHDMAKIGHLFLKGGEWDGEQIVSRKWVEEATSVHIHAGTLLDDYGFQWWVSPRGYYSAIGHKGQFIHVIPELDLVVVTTSHVAEDFDRIQSLLEAYIIPAAVS
jgi:CubicO group peptidase (beta-lactamase class C family)